eukprot:CAMPEP_0172681976 /NCGR_PEP_ID=MMETSP1074-20121228/17831_1 /TAXON_ID=2916 /ORGANISM="Ceratium fusus, Strain PA161109" /LENGTH=106 /DNA_ID=CAMNT_0013500565 /DNA_START=26 /DNA_END=346 /DNA_ORIENTATION=+
MVCWRQADVATTLLDKMISPHRLTTPGRSRTGINPRSAAALRQPTGMLRPARRPRAATRSTEAQRARPGCHIARSRAGAQPGSRGVPSVDAVAAVTLPPPAVPRKQ